MSYEIRQGVMEMICQNYDIRNMRCEQRCFLI